MLRTSGSLRENLEHPKQIQPDQGLGIQPQAGEYDAFEDSRGVGLKLFEPALLLDEPVIILSSTRQTMYSRTRLRR